jgi:hypothetical protein
MIVGVRHRRPLILVGAGWQSVFDQFLAQLGAYTPEVQRELLQFAPDIHTAVRLLDSNVS